MISHGVRMVYLQQFSARSLAIALSHCRSCRIGMIPTQYLNVKFGGLTVSRRHFRNISNAVCIPCYHSQLNYTTYSIKPVTPLFRKQKLSCLQQCVKFSSTSLMLRTPDSHYRISGVTAFPSVRKSLEDLNIFPSSYQPGQYNNLMCPKCEGGRTKERSLSLHIDPHGSFVMWICHRATCGWKGGTKRPMSVGSSTSELETLASENATSDFEVAHAISDGEVMDVRSNVQAIAQTYFTLENLQLEEVSNVLHDYFASRQISRETLQRNGVMQTSRNNKTVIAFTYRRNGKIVNCKYRDVYKHFWQEKHGEKIPYGLDDIRGARVIIIVEGEVDKLSIEEAGYKNCISVPNGSPSEVSIKKLPPIEQDKRYQYLWNYKEYFEQAGRIILATDADRPGQALAEELARRLGRERCWRVTWPRISENENGLCKDANEVLIRFGQQALKEAIEGAELYPIHGLSRFSCYFDEIDDCDNRELGIELGVSTGWFGLDELYRQPLSFSALGSMDRCNTSTSKHHAKSQQTTKDNMPKRQKQMSIIPSSIIQICSTAHSNVFEGDIVALYRPGQNRHLGSPIKAQLMYADLVDKDGQLTITVKINDNFIARFIEHFSIGNSVRIKDFTTRKKGPYCRGDANYAILLQEASSVENIPQVCKHRRLAPDSTIHELLASNKSYSVGSVAALVIGCQQSNYKFELKIKDGNTAADTTILQLSENYKDIFSQIQQLQSKEPPLYLFKNIVRNGLKGSQVLRSASSTFVDALNDDFAKAHLLTFVKSKNQVQGLLKAKSVFSPPFQQFCDRCKQPLPSNSSECTICKQDTICKFEHNVECTLETDDGIIECVLRMPQLQEFFPEIAQTSFDSYLKSISSTVFHLRKIRLKGLYTLTIDNVITDIKHV